MKPKFSLKERVIALERNVYYEAKILRCESFGKQHKYFIHYQNWDRKNDAWVDENQIEIYEGNEEKLKKKKPVTSNTVVEMNVEAVVPLNSNEISSNVDDVKTNKRKAEVLETETTSLTEKQQKNLRKIHKELASNDLIQDEEENTYTFKFNIPCDLVRHLVDEWIIISQESMKRFVKLPKTKEMTVQSIVSTFVDEKSSKLDKKQGKVFSDLMDGLCIYFDKALPKILLYRHERAQYDQLVSNIPNFRPSLCYGGEHLLRIFVRLPRLLSGVISDQVDMTTVFNRLNDLLKFLHKHCGKDNYVDISQYVSEQECVDIQVEKSKTASQKTKRGAKNIAVASEVKVEVEAKVETEDIEYTKNGRSLRNNPRRKSFD